MSSVLIIRDTIGDKANYLYAVIFSEGCGSVVGFVFIIVGMIHYQFIDKKIEKACYTKNK